MRLCSVSSAPLKDADPPSAPGSRELRLLQPAGQHTEQCGKFGQQLPGPPLLAGVSDRSELRRAVRRVTPTPEATPVLPAPPVPSATLPVSLRGHLRGHEGFSQVLLRGTRGGAGVPAPTAADVPGCAVQGRAGRVQGADPRENRRRTVRRSNDHQDYLR